MQPLPSSSHSCEETPESDTVRAFSIPVESPNSVEGKG